MKSKIKIGIYTLKRVGPTLDARGGFTFSNDDVNHELMSVKQSLTLKFWVLERNQVVYHVSRDIYILFDTYERLDGIFTL